MGLDARVFGRPAPAAIAKDVMSAGPLAQTPAPAQPADLVEHPNLANYYNALDATYEILKLEVDPRRRMKVEEARVFFESVIANFEEPDTTTQAPTPSPPPMPPPSGPTGGPPGPPPQGGGLPTPPPPGGDSVPATTAPPIAA